MTERSETTIRRLATLTLIALLGVSAMAGAQEDTWTKKADMPTARYQVATSVVDGIIYAIGGITVRGQLLSTVEAYDPVTDTWSRKTEMPTPRQALSTSMVDGKIYAIGGVGAQSEFAPVFTSTVEAYDPVTDTWTKKADMPATRAGLSTSAVNGKIYAIGGIGRQGVFAEAFTSTVYEYDPVTDTWTRKADMSTVRATFSTSVVDGFIYAIGGGTVRNGHI